MCRSRALQKSRRERGRGWEGELEMQEEEKEPSVFVWPNLGQTCRLRLHPRNEFLFGT